jgi:hypothetical protein
MHYLVNGTDWLELSGSGSTLTLSSTQGSILFNDQFQVCDGACGTPDTASGSGDLYVEDALEVDGATDLDGSLTVAGASTLSGDASLEGLTTITNPVMNFGQLRFCGQGANGATTTFISPDTFDGSGSLPGGAHCDAEDTTVEVDADEPLFNFAIKIAAMTCEITDAGVDDTYTFQLRSATADVTGITCGVTLDGSGVETCSVTSSSPPTVSAGATLAVSQVGTDDDQSAQDALCVVYYSH